MDSNSASTIGARTVRAVYRVLKALWIAHCAVESQVRDLAAAHPELKQTDTLNPTMRVRYALEHLASLAGVDRSDLDRNE